MALDFAKQSTAKECAYLRASWIRSHCLQMANDAADKFERELDQIPFNPGDVADIKEQFVLSGEFKFTWPTEPAEEIPIEKWKYDDLKAKAAELGIESTNVKKDDLIALITAKLAELGE